MSVPIRVLALLALVIAALAAAPVVAAAGPTKEVISLNDPALDAAESADLTATCGFPVIADNAGHVILIAFPGGNRSMQEIDVYGIRATYTNPQTGTMVRLVDVGPDRFYLRGDALYLAVTGRSLTGSGVIGQVVIDLGTGETVKAVGNDVGLFQEQVCDALAG